MPRPAEFMLDYKFAATCAGHPKASRVLQEYLVELFKHPELKEDKGFHHYYATRLVRIVEDKENEQAN